MKLGSEDSENLILGAEIGDLVSRTAAPGRVRVLSVLLPRSEMLNTSAPEVTVTSWATPSELPARKTIPRTEM